MPPLVGMLGTGLLLANANPIGEHGPLDADEPLLGESFEWWSSTIRAFALAVIMLRAGLGLNVGKLRQMGLTAAKLACVPCCTEALVVMVLAGPLLGLPWQWGGTLGFVLAAVSPAVVVPGMLSLQACAPPPTRPHAPCQPAHEPYPPLLGRRSAATARTRASRRS